jgi:catechol 2,3-dioxygenase-like lactoylglutathione lyase family enzyme
MMKLVLGLIALSVAVIPSRHSTTPSITTLAYRVHRMDAMVAFYSEAFGARFAPVQAGSVTSQFGRMGPVTLKFVPIRAAVDFTGFTVHQPGFEVADVQAVIAAALKHGGRLQDAPTRPDGRVHVAIRDPDGNTIELYGPK